MNDYYYYKAFNAIIINQAKNRYICIYDLESIITKLKKRKEVF
jgi:hypothetical protein